MKIKRRFPNYYSGFEDEMTEHEVNSREELLEIPWVKNLTEIPNHMGMFYSPNTSRFETVPDILMSLTRDENKTVYFAVGYIYGSGKDLGLENYENYI